MGGFEAFRVVNASAGSGKTHRLAELIVDRIAAGHSVSTILATTFTKRAASELTGRIRQGLLQAGRAADAQQLPDALIGTVDSVCGHLLAEFAIDAGLSPDLKVIAEAQQSEVFRIATEDILDQFAGQVEPVAHRLNCNGARKGLKNDPDWRDLVKSVADNARANRIAPQRLADSKDRSLLILDRALPAPEADGRSRWVQLATSAIEDLDEERRRCATGASKWFNYLDAVYSDLSELVQLAHGAAIDSVTWRQWGTLALVYTRGKRVEAIIGAGLHEVERTLLESNDFQSDTRVLIGVIFDCAAKAMSAFQVYKKSEGLIDYVDQETLVLNLLDQSAAVRQSISERLDYVVVDEFQDTSPLQLELFVRLGSLAKESVWVGDPKQAIYDFRGTDPMLMGKVAQAIADSGPDSVSTLSHSWRSKEVLVDFSNQLFPSIFKHLDPTAINLTVPSERAAAAAGGIVETWTLEATNVDNEALCLAQQIATFLAENRDRQPSDLAVLARTGDEVVRISDALNAIGIETSPPDQNPMDTTEMRFVMAGISYLLDERDTVALAELVNLVAEHPSVDSWLDEALTQSRAVEGWRDHAAIRSLDELREQLSVLTPLEVIEEVVGRLDIVSRIARWSHAAKRRTNIDSLRAHVQAYYDTAGSLSLSPSVSGLLRHLRALKKTDFQNGGRDVLTVLTYHKAKGLEWPVVVLTSLEKKARHRLDSVSVQSHGEFDPSHPLAGRWVQLWHDALETFVPWKYLQESLEEFDTAIKRETASESRLFYVGATRAADVLILTSRRPKANASSVVPSWCNLHAPNVLQWTPGSDHLILAGESFPATGRIVAAPGSDAQSVRSPAQRFTDNFAVLQTRKYEAKRFAASRVHADVVVDIAAVDEEGAIGPNRVPSAVEVKLVSRLGLPIVHVAGANASELGDAVHGFLALGELHLDDQHAAFAATRLLERHGVTGYLEVKDLLTIAERWRSFVDDHFPGAQVLAEHPVVWNTQSHQRMEGWIDALIKTDAGYVIVDHKSFSGSDPRGKIEADFTGQLASYKEAVEAATGSSVVGVYVHMPLRGEVYEVIAAQTAVDPFVVPTEFANAV